MYSENNQLGHSYVDSFLHVKDRQDPSLRLRWYFGIKLAMFSIFGQGKLHCGEEEEKVIIKGTQV